MRTALIVLLVLLGAFLLFWRLDGALLWRDECSTANWARWMVEQGYWAPRVFDGSQLIVQAADGHDFNSGLTPAMQGWLQFYVAAAAFKLLGASTWTARLPFALVGAICVFVLYRLGVVLFGSGLRPFLMPYLGLLSIYFLSAARQSRYYVLVVLAASLLFLELCRYFRDPSLASRRSFYARLGLAGLLLYFSNYMSFAGMWTSLAVFILLRADKQLTRGFFLLSAAMAPIVAADFGLFHWEFASRWPPPEQKPLAEIYRHALINRGRDFWRMTPLVGLVPTAFYLFQRKMGAVPLTAKLPMAAAALVPLSPVLFGFGYMDVHEVGATLFWLLLAASLTVPVTLLYCWRRLPSSGLWTQAALLAGLVILVSPLLTIAVGQSKTFYRHYYQVLPAVVLLGAIAIAGLERTAGKKIASAMFLGLLIWPNLNFNVNGFDHVVERQFFNDRSYNEPVVKFLRSRVRAGDELAVFRNVKGMTLFFYLPEIRWVAQLDSTNARNRGFRGLLPDDQFDDYPEADWYVVWDPRGAKPRGLSDQFERVWKWTYSYKQSWWDKGLPIRQRTYEVYRRREPVPTSSGSGGAVGSGPRARVAQNSSSAVIHRRRATARVKATPSGISRLSSRPRTPSRIPMPAGATTETMATSHANA